MRIYGLVGSARRNGGLALWVISLNTIYILALSATLAGQEVSADDSQCTLSFWAGDPHGCCVF